MVWRSCVATAVSLCVGAVLVASGNGWLGGDDIPLHDWGPAQDAATALAALQGLWAADPPETPQLTTFSAFVFTEDKMTWTTFLTAGGEILKVENADFDVAFDPAARPKRITLTPTVNPRPGDVQRLVYALEGDRLKVWRGVRDFPRPTRMTPPQFVLKKDNIPE